MGAAATATAGAPQRGQKRPSNEAPQRTHCIRSHTSAPRYLMLRCTTRANAIRASRSPEKIYIESVGCAALRPMRRRLPTDLEERRHGIRGERPQERRRVVRDDSSGEGQLRAEQLPRSRAETSHHVGGDEGVHLRVPGLLPSRQDGALQALPHDPRRPRSSRVRRGQDSYALNRTAACSTQRNQTADFKSNRAHTSQTFCTPTMVEYTRPDP